MTMDIKKSGFVCPYQGYIVFDYRNTSDERVGWIHTNESMVIRAGVFPAIILFGLIANLCFLFVLMRVKQMRTITNFYLANLAIADFLYLFMQGLTTGLNVLIYGFVQGQFYKSATGCVIGGTIFYWPYFTSIGLITLMTFERFIGICFPLQSRMISSKSRTVKLVILTWIFGFLPTLVRIPIKNVHLNFCIMWPNRPRYEHLTHFTRVCTYSDYRFREAWSFIEFTPFTIAMVCNIVFYSMIIKALSDRSSDLGDKASTEGNKLRNQVARMLIANGLVFFFCMSPYIFAQGVWVVLRFTNLPIPFWTPRFEYAFVRVAAAMTLVNSAVNPIVYSVSNPRVRMAFRKAFSFKFMRSEISENASHVSTNMTNQQQNVTNVSVVDQKSQI